MPPPKMTSPAVPVSAEGAYESCFADATLPASGDWVRDTLAGVINVQGARELTLWVNYDPAAVGNYPHIVMMVSNAQDVPAVDDDSWYIATHTDGVITDVTPDTGLPTGTDFSAPPPWGELTMKALIIRLPAAVGATDEYRYAIAYNVARYRWVQFMFAEKGTTATPGNLQANYSLSM